MLAPDDAEDLDIHDVRGRVIAVAGQPVADRLRAQPPINTSNKQEASTTSIGPRAALLVERCHDLEPPQRRGASPRALEPLLHAGPCDEARSLTSQQLRHADPGLGGASDQARVDIVVEVADLHCLGHKVNVASGSHHKTRARMSSSDAAAGVQALIAEDPGGGSRWVARPFK